MEPVASQKPDPSSSQEVDSLQNSLNLPVGLPQEAFDEYVPMDIFTAAAIGHFERLRELLQLAETDCDACNMGGWTPLMYAAYVGHDNAVNMLLDDGRLNVDICTPTGCTALILAASCGNESVAYFLVQHGASVNMRDMNGRTALFYAACKGHKTVVYLLLDNNADIDSRESEFGLTPLMAAAQEGHEAVISALLMKNADVGAMSNYGHTARALAVRSGHVLIVTLLDNALAENKAESLRQEPGLSDDLDDVIPSPYDGQWISKASSPRRQTRRLTSRGNQKRAKRPAGKATSDIQVGPAAMAQLFPSKTQGELNTAAAAAAAAAAETPMSPMDTAVKELGFSSHTDGYGAGDVVHSSSSSSADDDDDDDDNGSPDSEDDNVSGGHHFADMAASTVRASSGESAESSPQGSSMGRQLAELCAPDQKSTPKARRASSSSHRQSRNATAVSNPHYSGGSRTQGAATMNASTESDSPSSSQEMMMRRTARTPPRSPNHPTSIEEFLSALNLSKYLPLFEEQDVNMHALLTLTDNDLKEIGLKLFGPRRKIISAIARWHSQAWTGPSKLEQAYADHLEVRLKDLTDNYKHCAEQMESCQSQLQQEHDLRAVTETCLLDERTARQQLEQNLATARKVSKRARKQMEVATREQAQLLEQLKNSASASDDDLLKQAERCAEQLQLVAQVLKQ